MLREIIENPKYKEECDIIYDKFAAAYGEKMLAREHFNDVCSNMVRIAIPYIKATLPLHLEQLPELNFIGRIKYLFGSKNV